MTDNSVLLVLLLLILAAAALLTFARSGGYRDGLLESFGMGRYLAGYPGVTEKQENIECRINEASYTFVSGRRNEVGRIPRDSIIDIFYEVKGGLMPRLTTTKELSFSAFDLHKSHSPLETDHCLVIDWDDAFGTRHNTIFEFSGIKADATAHRAVERLKKYQKPHLPRLRADEKKCPLCAEIIKKEALVCRHCNQRV